MSKPAVKDTVLPDYTTSGVIIVETTISLSTVILEALHSIGFKNVTVFHNSSDAWNFFVHSAGTPHQPKIFIADTKAAGISGIDLLRSVRNFSPKQTKDLPFVLTSTHVTPEELKQAQLLQASEYIIKPYSVEELVKKVIRLLA